MNNNNSNIESKNEECQTEFQNISNDIKTKPKMNDDSDKIYDKINAKNEEINNNYSEEELVKFTNDTYHESLKMAEKQKTLAKGISNSVLQISDSVNRKNIDVHYTTEDKIDNSSKKNNNLDEIKIELKVETTQNNNINMISTKNSLASISSLYPVTSNSNLNQILEATGKLQKKKKGAKIRYLLDESTNIDTLHHKAIPVKHLFTEKYF
jgi:hypothetical protein